MQAGNLKGKAAHLHDCVRQLIRFAHLNTINAPGKGRGLWKWQPSRILVQQPPRLGRPWRRCDGEDADVGDVEHARNAALLVLGYRYSEAAIAQLGERQTEDLEVPGSIPGLGICAPTPSLPPVCEFRDLTSK